MGHAIGDWNNDGNLEWFSTAIYDNSQNCEVTGCMFGNRGNKLFENFGNRTFQDASRYVSKIGPITFCTLYGDLCFEPTLKQLAVSTEEIKNAVQVT